jgi:hypothetical protein
VSASVSALWTPALALSHGVVSTCDVLASGDVVSRGLPIVDGAVQIDRTAQFRRSIQNLTVADSDGSLVAALATDPLAPYGNELAVYSGIRYPDGTTETVQLGVFGISVYDVVNQAGHLITLTAFDRARTISRNKWTDGYVIAAGTNYGVAIRSLIADRLPGTTFALTATTATTPLLSFNAGDDPWAKATEMAAAIGYEVYFNRAGVCVIAPVPDVGSAAVAWQHVTGTGGVVLKIESSITNDPGYNGAVVTGQGPSNAAPVRAVSWDTNPTSPTYYLGKYGKVPEFITTPMVTTTAQAQAMADGRVRLRLGASQTVTYDIIPNPAIDEGDVTYLSDATTKIAGRYLIDATSIGLTSSTPQSIVVRQSWGLL